MHPLLVLFSLVLLLVRDPSSTKFHPLEVVPHYRDPQLQVGENYTKNDCSRV